MKNETGLYPQRSVGPKVVSIETARVARDETLDAKWQRFVDAKLLSERTLKLEDGIAAGKAYREFCESFARAS